MYLSEVPVETYSDEEHSLYTFGCGCIATRKASEELASVTWCSLHRPKPR
jgi:hypothetical protein